MTLNNVNLCVVLSLLIACISSGNAAGDPKDKKDAPDTIKHMAMIYFNNSKTAYTSYGGAIISDRHILTSVKKLKYILEDLSNVCIFCGAKTFHRHMTTGKIERIFIHPNYEQDQEFNNLAILKTVDKIDGEPIELPKQDFPNEDDILVKVSGNKLKNVSTKYYLIKE